MSNSPIDYKKFYEKQMSYRKRYNQRKRTLLEVLKQKVRDNNINITSTDVDQMFKKLYK